MTVIKHAVMLWKKENFQRKGIFNFYATANYSGADQTVYTNGQQFFPETKMIMQERSAKPLLVSFVNCF